MRYHIEDLRKFGTDILVKAGLPEKEAAINMDSFITADLRGVRTHGVTHLKEYCDRLRLGTAVSQSQMQIEQTSPTSIVVDAKHAIGMSAAMTVMELCVKKAEESGACFAAVKNGNHYGFGAYFPMYAAKKDMIGVSLCNTPHMVTPFGGAEPLLGTNPLSIAIPAGKHPDLVLDMATSLVAKGKISLALKEGKTIPLGWAVDKLGNPTTDPAAADVGALLPFGGPKGYAIGLIISLISFALAGGEMDINIPRSWQETDKLANTGYFMGAINIAKYVKPEIFKSRVDQLFDLIKSSRPAPGFEAVLIPGEIEYNMTQANIKNGIEISDAGLRDFKQLSERYGVAFNLKPLQ
jgi:LDH2 family malate/lactate/ureidoglycolate dehydrogenase